ncbi:Cerato-platanin [Boletus edulis]|uniref:Cerato-platanin n=1 Tax=Boletus edulis BED1 TaxID=1328754 RepID=A0AAD4BQA8_BOLED|nr:Cerato-platanin [Boletus edulis]KAF8436481.1 Cerato-platanin [Boletus edulis BED1]
MYHPTTLLAATLVLASSVRAIQLKYDNTYDTSGLSLDTVACSNGPNGLETKYGYTTLGTVPAYPNLGAVYTVSGWDSPKCGACYAVTYQATGVTVNILAVDKTDTGFTVSQQAMDNLTANHAVEFGHVEVSFEEVDPSRC